MRSSFVSAGATRVSRAVLRREDNWSAWSSLVQESLASSPTVTEADLVEIPAGFRRWVLSKYAAGQPELTFNAELGQLESAVSARATPGEP